MTSKDIIKMIYALDENGHYTNNTIHTFSECPEWLKIEILLHHSPRFMYLLFSKYNGNVYKPERFEELFK